MNVAPSVSIWLIPNLGLTLYNQFEYSKNIVIPEGELPVKFFKSSGHWILQIDLEEYLPERLDLQIEA